MLNKPWREIAGCKVFGNNHDVPIVCGFELTDKEKREFDYLSDSELDESTFFRYKGNVYYTGEFERTQGSGLESIADGIHNDTYFSGILVKYCEDNDFIKVYTFYSGS